MRAQGRGRGRFALRMVGFGLAGVSIATAVLAVIAWAWKEPWSGFAWASGLAALVAGPSLAFGRTAGEPSRREALLAVLALWWLIPLVGSVPFVVNASMPFLDAWFEAMSGFTATGATAIADFGAVSSTLFLWRALSQWVGGVGIIVVFVAVFPQLAIAGRQLFVAEMPGPSEEQVAPRLRRTAGTLLVVYLGMSVAAVVSYAVAGMGWFDAVAHAMTTVSAAGFSPEARSFEAFGAAVQWVAIVFMTLAGANFVLQFQLLSGRPRQMFRNEEFRVYLTVFLVAGLTLTLLLQGTYGAEALRHGLFQAISILTTTGYATVDFGAWGVSAQTVLVLLMFIGGSAGSAAGGMKVVRLMIVAKMAWLEVRRVLHPRAVLPVRVSGRPVPEDVVRAVAAFVTVYALLFAVLVISLALLGVEFTTAFTASIATLGNVGPGLGAVGPMGSFAVLPDVAKALLTFAMFAGRLEVMAVFVLLSPDVWRVPRGWRRETRS